MERINKFLKFFGAIFGIFAGTLLLICGGYNLITGVLNGQWSALGWLVMTIFGGYFIDLGTEELRKRRTE